MKNTIARSILIFFFLGLLACQREQSPLMIELDKTIYNSYHQALRGRNTISLLDDETVMFGLGHQKVSTRSADVTFKDTQFRISFIDSNQDGDFSQSGIDIVCISVFGQDTVALDLLEDNVGLLRQRTFLQINRYFFLLDELDPEGQYLTLIPWDRPPADALAARTKTHLAKLSVKNDEGKEEYLTFSGKGNRQQLLLFWNYSNTERELLQTIAGLQPQWNEKLSVVTLNMNDQLWPLKAFQINYAIDLPFYLVTSKTCKSINCHANLPYGILLDAEGKILRNEMRKEAILELLRGSAI